jgi:hypothetical protein
MQSEHTVQILSGRSGPQNGKLSEEVAGLIVCLFHTLESGSCARRLIRAEVGRCSLLYAS